MAKNIQDIEGIGPGYAEALKAAGITSTRALLDAAADRKGRETLAQRCNISERLVLKWANMADLFRIKGIAGQYAELLEAAGVDTVKELRTRNADNLAAAMKAVNEEKRLVRQVPSAKTVAAWIEQAGTLEPRITH